MDTSVLIAVILVLLVCVVLGVLLARRGRAGKQSAAPAMSEAESAALAAAVLQAIGGKENLAVAEYCSTRLRLEVKRYASVDEAAIKAAGAAAVVRAGKNSCQVAVGTQAPQVYAELKKLL